MSSLGDVLNNVHDGNNASLRVNAILGTAGYSALVLPATLPSTPAALSSAPGKFAGYTVMNTGAALAYLFIWDASSQPTIGSTAPLLKIPLPWNSVANNGSLANLELFAGITATSKLWYCVSSTYAGVAQTSGVQGTLYYA